MSRMRWGTKPAGFVINQSVREYAEFLSGTVLNLGLESYVERTPPPRLRSPLKSSWQWKSVRTLPVIGEPESPSLVPEGPSYL